MEKTGGWGRGHSKTLVEVHWRLEVGDTVEMHQRYIEETGNYRLQIRYFPKSLTRLSTESNVSSSPVLMSASASPSPSYHFLVQK